MLPVGVENIGNSPGLRIGSKRHVANLGEALMATRDTGGQSHRTKKSQETEEESAEATEEIKERQEKLSDDVDAILDEIDEVLESNAEDFVRSFVQKGGQ